MTLVHNRLDRRAAMIGTLSRIIAVSSILLLCLLASCLTMKAQATEFTQNTGGTNAMTMQVPLANYPGRGVSLPITLNYSTNGLWRVAFHGSYVSGGRTRAVTEALYAEHSTAGWTTSLNVPEVEWPRQTMSIGIRASHTLSALTTHTHFGWPVCSFHMPDGSTHELRKSHAVYQDSGKIDMSGTFYAVDSSRMRYDSTGASTGTLADPNLAHPQPT